MRVVAVIGTRPEAVKMAPVVKALHAAGWADTRVLLTGQHRELLDSTLADFGLRGDIDLELMQAGQTLGTLTGRAFLALEEVLGSEQPDLVLAQGDTTTVMTTAVSCFYAGVAFGHVEAGLRTGDLRSPFPEEFNRVVAGKLARLHFAPTPAAAQALLREGQRAQDVYVTGNTVVDALADASARVDSARFRPAAGRKLILMTLHRREYFGGALEGVLRTIRRVVEAREEAEVLFPAHPNPAVRRAIAAELPAHPRIRVVEPLGYLDFVAAMKAADFIVTDSGGVQEEAPFLRKPVLVTRNETERPEACQQGVARLVGTDPGALEAALLALLDDPSVYRSMARGVSPYGDGRAAARIVGVIGSIFGVSPEAPPAMFEPPLETPEAVLHDGR